MSIYNENGFSSREEYLESLADEFDCPIVCVEEIADFLGSDEDFDGLFSSLEDAYGY